MVSRPGRELLLQMPDQPEPDSVDRLVKVINGERFVMNNSGTVPLLTAWAARSVVEVEDNSVLDEKSQVAAFSSGQTKTPAPGRSCRNSGRSMVGVIKVHLVADRDSRIFLQTGPDRERDSSPLRIACPPIS